MATMESGITTKLYSLWLRSEDKGYILFINLVMKADERQSIIGEVVNFTGDKSVHANSFALVLVARTSVLETI